MSRGFDFAYAKSLKDFCLFLLFLEIFWFKLLLVSNDFFYPEAI